MNNYFVFSLIFILYIVSIPLASMFGSINIEPIQVLELLGIFFNLMPADHADLTNLLIVGELRLARIILALLCGGGLAIAGVALQGVLHNPLADPFTLGISAGAACGVSFAIAGGTYFVSIMADYNIPHILANKIVSESFINLMAFVGSLIGLFMTLALSYSKGNFQQQTVILAGIAVATFLGALITLIKALNEESVTSIIFWLMGSLQGKTWDNVLLMLVPLCIGLIIIAVRWRQLDALLLGDVHAMSIGLDVKSTRLWLLVGTSFIAAACVSAAGIIAFVGLVIPHILRLIMGSTHALLLISAWFSGGLLLLWSDVIARTLLSDGQELPVGVVTALLGGPFFAFLVYKKEGKA